MKKIISFLLILSTLISFFACSSTLVPEETLTATKEETKAEEVETEEPLPTGDIVYPEGFSVGYNRQSVAPEVLPVPTYAIFNHIGYTNHDPVQLTCTAISDGKTAFLLISLDMRGIDEGFAEYSCKVIEKATGIPKEQVMINCTHTHSSPDHVHLGEGNMKQWQELYYRRLERAAVLALHDLTPTEAYIGTAHTEGVTFVRRYLMKDGKYETNPDIGAGAVPIAHESEADTELRTVRFDRGEAKDVLLVNYQTHYHGTFATQVSADFVHPLREQVEKEMDVHFAYHSGAGANINFRSELPGEKKYNSMTASTAHIAEVVKTAVENEEKANLTSMQCEYSVYNGRALGGKDVREVPFTAFTIGDIGFAAVPYEMFDTNGKEVRDASPCKMTFVCSLTNGYMGYVPSAAAYPHGAYEVDITKFEEGSGEEFAEELVRMLKACKDKDKG